MIDLLDYEEKFFSQIKDKIANSKIKTRSRDHKRSSK